MREQRVLVVSATRDTADWLAEMLGLPPTQVDAVPDGAEAFQRVWDADYDVIVAEIGVPGVDGRDLYMAFQNTWPELTRRMVFVCGQPNPALESFAGRTGVPLVRGPVSAMAMREAVRTAAAAPRPRALAS